MNYIKTTLWGPDPKEQHRKLKSILRKNDRQLNKSLNELSSLKSKTQNLIKQAAKKNDIKTVRLYAKELYHVNKQYDRMYTSKAQLQSVGMKIEESFQMNKLQDKMAQSAVLMREVNSLVQLPQLRATMMDLEKELVKSGIITEMMDDTMEPYEDVEEEEEVNEQVEQIVAQYTSEKLDKVEDAPNIVLSAPEPEQEISTENQEVVPESKIDSEADDMIKAMKERLNALQG
ncbi:Vacuolar protein-sorting-associated protein 24 [Kluyveromyces marxianus]|nr:Vacuolar protein-sorting-associated protein 24 [Kluyveromyces marxianus]KAG0683638.1 Vacuolar protein-sorting-associated protein 24 [Kluyveromyces marxianus]